jgi:glycosyltransferase involved in cell wall biosynthesis
MALRASVCIPTHNRAATLKRTLESLDRQTVAADRFEVIVADDGSTDATAAMLETDESRFELRRIRLDGCGSGAARNAAARAARNDVLIFLDDDQVASPDLVAVHLETQERCGVVIVQGEYPLAVGGHSGGASLIYERSRRRTIGCLERAGPVAFRLWGANFSVRRDSWAAAGGFDENLPRKQDLDFGLRLADLGIPLVSAPGAVSHHLHQVSIDGLRRQAVSEGRCLVRISRKRRVSVESLVGQPIDRLVDRLVSRFWRRFPRWAALSGRYAGGLLWTADRFDFRAGQILSSRVLRRFHVLGGIALEMGEPV